MDEITKYIWQKNTIYDFHSFQINPNHQETDLQLRKNGKITIISNNLDECIENGAINCSVDDRNFRIILRDYKFRDYNIHEESEFFSESDKNLSTNSDIYINKNFFFGLLQIKFSKHALDNSKNYLSKINNKICAKDINYRKIFFYTILIALLFCCALPKSFLLLGSLLNIITIFFKIYLSVPAISIKDKYKNEYKSQYKSEYPIYTVLFPLYKEVNKINQIINVIKSINYPKEKLDVKIIIEEDDYMIIREVNSVDLPDCVHVIKVPEDKIKTKPKALNYAASFAIGEYITVYDAEDIPDSNQLLNAVNEFNNLPDEYICLQSKLDFYNENENILTKLISLEYKIWFNIILEGLSILNLPITLGGTSNHFKFKKLKEIGMWDAYNVTEDAELGLRIYIKGYKTKIINSFTLEEAPITIELWFNQRVRWVKGFYQTFLTYLKYKNKDLAKLNIYQKISIWILVCFNTLTFVISPLSFLVYMFFTLGWMKNWFYFYLFFGLICNLFFLLVIYLFSSRQKDKFVSSKLKKSYILAMDFFGVVTFYFYFVLHSFASIKAIYEIIFKPFRWNKTSHGLSKIFFKKNLNFKK